MTRRLLSALSLLLLLAMIAGACAAPAAAPSAPAGGAGTETEAPAGEAAAPATGTPLKVLLFINGTLGDKSFFDSAKRGIDRAVSELGVEANTIEATYDATQWEPALVDALA